MGARCTQNMGPRVEDWVRTLNMSKKMINLLKLPLQMPLEEFLEGLPGEMDAQPEERLERYIEERETEALLENEAEWVAETSRFRMFGAGNRSSMTFAQQVLRTPLERAAPLPTWRDEHATPQAVGKKKRRHKSDSDKEETKERETKEDEPPFEMPADVADYDGSQGALPQEQADARWDALVPSEQSVEAQAQAEPPPVEPVEQPEPVSPPRRLTAEEVAAFRAGVIARGQERRELAEHAQRMEPLTRSPTRWVPNTAVNQVTSQSATELFPPLSLKDDGTREQSERHDPPRGPVHPNRPQFSIEGTQTDYARVRAAQRAARRAAGEVEQEPGTLDAYYDTLNGGPRFDVLEVEEPPRLVRQLHRAVARTFARSDL